MVNSFMLFLLAETLQIMFQFCYNQLFQNLILLYPGEILLAKSTLHHVYHINT